MSRIEPHARIPVGVLVERRKAQSVWTDFVWQPVAVLAGEPAAAPWTMLDSTADCTTFYAGVAQIELYRSDCVNYRVNIGSETPMLWVVLRAAATEPPFTVFAVTADPGEGEAFSVNGDDLVETVPMPQSVRDVIAAFIAEHHVSDTPFSKRQRDRADPEALARRIPIKDRK